MIKVRLFSMVNYFILFIGSILVLTPVYLTITVAFKTREEVSVNFYGLPKQWYFDNFINILQREHFWKVTLNSFAITIISLIFMVIFIPMVSFAISRNAKRKYFQGLYYFILSGIFVPFQAVMLPIYLHMSNLKLLNQTGLIIMYITLSFAQGIFLCVGFLKNIPLEFDQASKIDGCGVWTTFTKVIYPLMIPIISTILILNSLWIWNDFQLPLIMLNRHPDFWTLPLFIYNFKSEVSFDFNLAFAAFVLSMAPITLVYIFTQRYIIGGLTEGAIKS